MNIDYDAAFEKYNVRYEEKLGAKPIASYAKFNKHMIKRLARGEFDEHLDKYVQLHGACKRMLDGGSTISDALVHDFEEAAAWVAVEAPDLYAMFRGEIGDPSEAAPEMKE